MSAAARPGKDVAAPADSGVRRLSDLPLPRGLPTRVGLSEGSGRACRDDGGQWFEAGESRRYDRNEPQWRMARIDGSVYSTPWSNSHRPWIERNRSAGLVDEVLPAARQDEPGVLTGRVHVQLDALTWLDMPADDGSLSGLIDGHPRRLDFSGLEEGGRVEDTFLVHMAPRKPRSAVCKQPSDRQGPKNRSLRGLTLRSAGTTRHAALAVSVE